MRTNIELKRILKIYNGSNDVQVLRNFPQERVNSSYRVDKVKNQVINTHTRRNSTAPHRFVLKKGYTNVVLDRDFATYAMKDPRAQDLLNWLVDTLAPEETLIVFFVVFESLLDF